MGSKKFFLNTFIFLVVVGILAFPVQAAIYPLDIFTNNGLYSHSHDVVLSAEVADGGAGRVSFVFHNENLIGCSVAGIYFGDRPFLGSSAITNVPGVKFAPLAAPDNLPAGHMLNPIFTTSQGFQALP